MKLPAEQLMRHWHDNSLDRVLHNFLQESQSSQNEQKQYAILFHRSVEVLGFVIQNPHVVPKYQLVEDRPLIHGRILVAHFEWSKRLSKGCHQALHGSQVSSHQVVTTSVECDTCTRFIFP